MGALSDLKGRDRMASRWRRRPMCVLVSEGQTLAALRSISAGGAFVETNARPPLGSSVELRHPEAGSILGNVCSFAPDGVSLRFADGEGSVAFAMAAIAADMSRPPR